MVSNPKKQIEVEVIAPSKLLPNKAGQFFKSLFLGQIKEQYADRFGDQPYSLRNRKKYEFAYYVSYAFQILSILFATSFAVHLFSGLLPAALGGAKFYVAIGIGLIVLVMLELAKRIVITDAVDSFLKAKAIESGFRTNYLNVLLAGLLIALSIYSSVAGAKYFVELQMDNTVEITSVGQNQKDSVTRAFDKRIEGLRNDIAQITKRNSWKGSVWIAKNDKPILNGLENQVIQLEADRASALQAVNNITQKSLTENQSTTADSAWKLLGFSFGCEILTLVCLWFLATYIFKSGLEMTNNEVGQLHSKNLSSEIPQIKPIGFAVAYQKRTLQGRNGRVVFGKPKKTNPIGFVITKSVNDDLRNDEDRNITKVVSETDQSLENNKIAKEITQKKVIGKVYQCEHCQQEYLAKSFIQKFCSTACRHEHHHFDLAKYNQAKKRKKKG